MTTQQYLMILATIYISHFNSKATNAIFGFSLMGVSLGMLLGWL